MTDECVVVIFCVFNGPFSGKGGVKFSVSRKENRALVFHSQCFSWDSFCSTTTSVRCADCALVFADCDCEMLVSFGRLQLSYKQMVCYFDLAPRELNVQLFLYIGLVNNILENSYLRE
jgi:hypothetical protein